MDETVVRESLVDLLTKEQAHAGAKSAFEGLAPENRSRRAHPSGHSPWELLEHLRVAQEDIVRYTLDASWVSPPWPEGYWPQEGAVPTDAQWNASLKGFHAGIDETVALARDRSVDLTAQIPHGEHRTFLRQILLVADHNAYHLAQVVETRKALGDWKED
jgi:DinB family protein